MDLLLRITTKPIEYQIRTEAATLTPKQTPPERIQNSEPVKVNLKTTDAQVDMDFAKMYESLGMRNVGDVTSDMASKAVQAASSAIGDIVQMGNSLSQIQNGATIGDYIKNRNLSSASITGQLSEIPVASPELSFERTAVNDITVDRASVEQQWDIEKNTMEYVPGKYHMEITGFPEVKIEYVGGMSYVPPSADPEYEETEN